MIDFKDKIAEEISKVLELTKEDLKDYIEIPKDTKMGDYALPCFKLAKEMKKSPVIIANEIKEKIEMPNQYISKIEAVNGFLNIFINNEMLIENVLDEMESKKENYGSSNIGNGKNIIVEYSSPNIAKPFHVGHLRTTVIGRALYNMYKFLGYNTIGINHLGDWGTQFGKLIEGYKRFGNEYNLEENPIDKLTEIYVRINELCKEDESVLDDCRNNFKKLEDGDKYCIQIWQKFKDLSLKEFQRIYDVLGIHFDYNTGESFYVDKMPEVLQILRKNNKLVESQGAEIVDLEYANMPPLMAVKSNGSTTYAMRDLAAILYRARTYDFDKCIYVVAYEQNLHFKQAFEVAKFLDLDEKYTNGLIHVPYGMVRLKTGKMSTREGTLIKLEDILKEAVTRAKAIIEEKNPNIEGKEDIAKKVGIGAVIFNDLSNNIIKDEVFDWDIMLNFQGETGPYIQYMYVRTKSILEKENYTMNKELVDISELEEHGIELIKQIYSFNDIVKQAVDKNEPSIISRYLIDVAKLYSSFYNDNKIIVEDEKIKNTRLCLTYMVGNVLKIGTGLLGMEMPDRM
ncbi:arginine--tRNA ligase [Clostridium sp. CAG:354]|jgi:arginyl-tRNA synthetase|nr:arginine--tRNA ligase [Clostridium sp.]MEE0269138.1 arginine--tRNA ligase [Clostridia bacterium]CDE10018.1 arginine--tRNA ligase [Clostridium sp. CAG:354]